MMSQTFGKNIIKRAPILEQCQIMLEENDKNSGITMFQLPTISHNKSTRPKGIKNYE